MGGSWSSPKSSETEPPGNIEHHDGYEAAVKVERALRQYLGQPSHLFTPKEGCALTFRVFESALHKDVGTRARISGPGYLHDSEPVQNGRKFIFRTDVLYKKSCLLGEVARRISLCPSELRYSQDSIVDSFSCGRAVADTIDEIASDTGALKNVPLITVKEGPPGDRFFKRSSITGVRERGGRGAGSSWLLAPWTFVLKG